MSVPNNEFLNQIPSEDIYHQKIVVNFDYPVIFTQGLFELDNPIFAGTLSRKEPDRIHNVIVYIDSGVADKNLALIDTIKSYFNK